MARAGARRVEIGIRSALGATRGRIVRQLLAESLLLALAGGACGVLLAAWGVRVLDGLIPASLPRGQAIAVDFPVLMFTAAVSIVTGVLFGVVPALQTSRSNVAALLKEAARDGSTAGSKRRLRQGLVAAEVALALVLLTGAGLALRSFDRLNRVDPGFDPTGALAITIALPQARYPDAGAASRLVQEYLDALASQPGVSAAGAVMSPPLGGGSFAGTFSIVASGASPDASLQVRPATPGYFESLAIPLRRGRTFTRDDRTGGVPVAIISEDAARRFWPGQDPIGQRLRIHVSTLGPEPEREIVGIVGDVSLRSLDSAQLPAVYVPHAQYYSGRMTIFVRTGGDPLALVPAARSQLAVLDRQIAPIVRPAGQIVAASVSQPRFRLVLFATFAAIALALAAVGLYGVMAFTVSQRQAEIGLRMALGADAGTVLRMVMRQAMAPVGTGIAAGLLGAAAVTRTLSALLFQTSAFDPLTYAAVALLLATVAVAACYLPARRAARIDPLVALRAS
jgi:putative ABC transport system permease protein